ncbi:hypothetical protein BTVI_26525 [Pitangus sulphuratus]|nr:hypothetical protein BTVI_26525 [Pitangus sulphuratus]
MKTLVAEPAVEFCLYRVTGFLGSPRLVCQTQTKPWWKIQLFVWEPVLFGTWDGVFTSCMINIFGVVLFLRTGWLVGNTGIVMGMFLVSFVILVALVTVLSGIGVCEKCSIGSGGVYSMISTVLGGQIAGTIGILYIFGQRSPQPGMGIPFSAVEHSQSPVPQCVAGAMYITGFAESIADVLSLSNIWAVRGISLAVLFGLQGINLAGVKWIIRLQLLLLFLLAVSTLDFVIGSFTHLDPGFHGVSLLEDIRQQDFVEEQQTDLLTGCAICVAMWIIGASCPLPHAAKDEEGPDITWNPKAWYCKFKTPQAEILRLWELPAENGFVGYSAELMSNNTLPDYSQGESFFTVFGVFFPAATGVMVGFDMSRDLQKPATNIPLGSLAAIGTSWFLYMVFVFLLGAICTRQSLRYDFMIAEKKGPNKTPVAAICLTSFITMAFVFIGQVNVLAPIVTINYMLTYTAVDYCYFAVSLSHSIQQKPDETQVGTARPAHSSQPLIFSKPSNHAADGVTQSRSNGTLLEFKKDMDQIFKPFCSEPGTCKKEGAENLTQKAKQKKAKKPAKQTLQDSFLLDLHHDAAPAQYGWDKTTEPHSESQRDLDEQGCQSDAETSIKQQNPELGIQQIPESFYSRFFSHWVSFAVAIVSLIIMFVIQWIYTLVSLGAAVILYFYIGRVSPGLPLGAAANFSFFGWIKSVLITLCRRRPSPKEQIVVTPSFATVGMETRQLTEENTDFASRDRYHQSSLVSREEFGNQFQ